MITGAVTWRARYTAKASEILRERKVSPAWVFLLCVLAPSVVQVAISLAIMSTFVCIGPPLSARGFFPFSGALAEPAKLPAKISP